MKKYANWLTALVVVLMLAVALSIQFSPEQNFKDALLRLAELPKNIFHFVWERDEEPEETTEPTRQVQQQKEETPFLSFDDLETMPEECEYIPLQTIPASGINELPMDVLKGSVE